MKKIDPHPSVPNKPKELSKSVTFGYVRQHKFYNGIDPDGSEAFLMRASLNSCLAKILTPVERYELEKLSFESEEEKP